jgi:hypothetical protein
MIIGAEYYQTEFNRALTWSYTMIRWDLSLGNNDGSIYVSKNKYDKPY